MTTPIIALGLGAEWYGLYTLLFLFLGYASALDLGLSFSLVKHIAEHDPTNEREEIESLLSAAAAVYTGISLIFMLALVLGRGWIAYHLLRLPERLVPAAKSATLILACSVPFNAAITIFGAVFRGLLRFDHVAVFSLMNGSLYAVGAAVLVAAGARLNYLIALYTGLMAVSAAVQWLALRRVLPGLRIVPGIRVSRLRDLFGFGTFMTLNQVGQIALLQLDRVVITRMLSLTMTAYYAVPLSIAQRIGILGAAASTVTFPHASASIARGQLEEFRREYLQSARVVAWLTLAPALVVIVLADKFLASWMSLEFAANGTIPLRLLAFSAFWIAVASLGAVSIEGSGRPWATAAFMGGTGVFNIMGLIVLTPRWGLAGAAGSVMFSLMVLATLDVWYCSRTILRSPIRDWGRSVGLPTVATVLVNLPVLLVLRTLVSSLLSLIVVGTCAAALTALTGYWIFLSAAERQSLRARAAGVWAAAGL